MHIIRPKDGGYGAVRRISKDELARSERELQTLVEDNLLDIFGLEFLRTGFGVGGKEVDTVAFERDSSSFVIIEYKKKRHRGALEQVMSYHAILNNNKEAFYGLYRDRVSDALDMEHIDFDGTRIIVIAPSFTDHQLNAVESAPRGSELYEVAEYEDGTVALCRACHDAYGRTSRAGVATTEEHHLAGKGSEGLYYRLKERLLERFDLEVSPTGSYIGFRSKDRSVLICAVRPVSGCLNLEYVTTDPKVLPQDDGFVEPIPHNKKYRSQLKNEADIDKAVELVGLVLASRDP